MNLQQAKQIINLTKESYDKIAGSFSNSRQENWPEVKNLVKNYIHHQDPISNGINKILDLGCGNGRLIQLLKNYQNISYTGLDNSVNLINKARGKYPEKNIQFIPDDILNLNRFESNYFDKIFLIASFNHLPSQELREKTLINLHRILKPQGILIMTNWNLWQINTKKNIWRYKFRQNYQTLNSKYNLKFKDVITFWQNKYPLYYHAFTLKELKKLFTKTGLQILQNQYVNNNQPAHWWNGRNIVTVVEKVFAN